MGFELLTETSLSIVRSQLPMPVPNAERRGGTRYPVHFEADYRVFAKGHAVVSGVATTLNMSSHGLLLSPTEGVSRGQVIELSIRWSKGHAGIPNVDLEVIGRVVRVDEQGTAVQIIRYGFNWRQKHAPAV